MRKYGSEPYTVAILHGGPGAAGEMAPVARALSASFGILEPFQCALSIEGQLNELHYDIMSATNSPIVLAGYSWGAWLACIFAARFPELVKKVILISSGSFEDSYASDIDDLRLSRLSENERSEIADCARLLADSSALAQQEQAFGRIGQLFGKADSFDLFDGDPEELSLSPTIFGSVWPEAAIMRASGELLNIVRAIRCPLTAIHGSFDPHNAEGVRVPLSGALKDFHFEIIENCGHTPWKEKQARDKFFLLLRSEISSAFKTTPAIDKSLHL